MKVWDRMGDVGNEGRDEPDQQQEVVVRGDIEKLEDIWYFTTCDGLHLGLLVLVVTKENRRTLLYLPAIRGDSCGPTVPEIIPERLLV